jgi:hypothetical protein
VKIEQILWQRSKESKEMGFWKEGDVGYLALKQHNKVVTVVVGKVTSAGNYQLFPIGENKNRYYRLNEAQMRAFMFDMKQEAQEFLKK